MCNIHAEFLEDIKKTVSAGLERLSALHEQTDLEECSDVQIINGEIKALTWMKRLLNCDYPSGFEKAVASFHSDLDSKEPLSWEDIISDIQSKMEALIGPKEENVDYQQGQLDGYEVILTAIETINVANLRSEGDWYLKSDGVSLPYSKGKHDAYHYVADLLERREIANGRDTTKSG